MTRVIVCRVGRLPTLQDLPSDPRGGHLSAMQDIVGGLVDCVGLTDGLDLWCNDEGIILDLPLNRSLHYPLGRVDIYGDFMISRVTDDGDVASVTDSDFAYYRDLFDSEDVAAAFEMNLRRDKLGGSR